MQKKGRTHCFLSDQFTLIHAGSGWFLPNWLSYFNYSFSHKYYTDFILYYLYLHMYLHMILCDYKLLHYL